MSLIYGAILIVSIIAIHEFGHYFIGKLFGIKFSTFCIGMGPRIFKKRLGDTLYYISILPIGGYVRSNVHKEIEAKESLFLRMGNFLAPVDKEEYELIKKHKSEVKVQLEDRNPFGFVMYLLGGAIFNILSCMLLIFTFYFFVSSRIVHSPSATVGNIKANSLLSNAGLKKGDVIKDVNGIQVYDWGNVLYYYRFSKDENLKLTVERTSEDKRNILYLNIKATNKLSHLDNLEFLDFYKPIFGFDYKVRGLTFHESLSYSYRSYIFNLKTIGNIFYGLFEKKVRTNSTKNGFISSTMELGYEASRSNIAFMSFFVIISLLAAFVNLLPFPGSDGFQLLTFFLHKFFAFEISDERKLSISYFGLSLMVLFLVYLTITDFIEVWM